VLKHPTPSVSLGMGLESASAWSFAVGGNAIWGDRFDKMNGTVELGLESAWGRLCLNVLGSASGLGLHLCAEPMVGRLRGRAIEGYGHPKKRSLFWPALAWGLRAQGPVGEHSRWLFSALAVHPLLRHRFAITALDGENTDVYRSRPLGMLAELGVAWLP